MRACRMRRGASVASTVSEIGGDASAGSETANAAINTILGISPQCRGEGGEVAAERPAVHADALEVELGQLRGERVEGGDLVVEDRAGEVAADGALEGAAAVRGAAAVDGDDQVAVVGEPLAQQQRLHG